MRPRPLLTFSIVQRLFGSWRDTLPRLLATIRPLIALLLVIALPTQQLLAFWPWNIRLIFSSPFDDTHESITKSAMKDLGDCPELR